MEIKEVLQKIDGDALLALCDRYDTDKGVYPKHPYEGAAVYRFYRKMTANETESKSGFVNYILGNGSSGSLREMFYNYFIAHLGTLPEDDRVCEKEIKEGLYTFFNERVGKNGR